MYLIYFSKLTLHHELALEDHEMREILFEFIYIKNYAVALINHSTQTFLLKKYY